MPVSHIDFAQLDLGDALDLAILIEQEAEDRYLEFSATMQTHHSARVAAFFRTMAGYEAAHGQELSRMREALADDHPRRIAPQQIFDVEAPGFETIHTFMGLRQALLLAREAEQKAHDFYDQALAHISRAEVKTLFEQLRSEEVAHIALVQKEIDQLVPQGGLVPDDAFSDPPVAQ